MANFSQYVSNITAKFSVKNAIAFGFQAYAQNLLLMVCVGATIGLSLWGIKGVPRLVANQLGINLEAVPVNATYKQMGPQQTMHHEALQSEDVDADASKMTKINHHLKEAAKRIHGVITENVTRYLDQNPTHLILLFFLWVLMLGIFFLVQMGVIRVALDIVDKNSTSYSRVFSQRALFLPYVGLMIAYVLLMFCIFFGASIVGIIFGGLLSLLLGYVFGGPGVSIGVAVGTLTGVVIFVKFMMRYVFAFYCLVDKKMGVHKSLSTTYEITKGSVVKLIVLGIITWIPVALLGGAAGLAMIGQHASSDLFLASIITKILGGLIGAWYTLCFVYVYRKLSKA